MLANGPPASIARRPAALAPPLTLVRTDIAGFVGYAERGPLSADFPPGF